MVHAKTNSAVAWALARAPHLLGVNETHSNRLTAVFEFGVGCSNFKNGRARRLIDRNPGPANFEI